MKFTRHVALTLVCVAFLYTITEVFRRREFDLPEVHRESSPPAQTVYLHGEDAGS